MRLIRLHVESFGVLQNFDLELDEGLNVLYERNGWGKSTLAVFIKAMLYGLPATTKQSLEENERKKYAPWQGGAYGGSLEFECARGKFRIERFFGARASQDRFALYDLSTNQPSEAFGTSVGEELFGVDADGFERSTYLSQRSGYVRSDNTSIRAKLGDLLDDINDMANYDTADAALEKRRKFYQMTGSRGAIADEKAKLMGYRAELESLLETERLAELKKEERRTVAERIAEAEAEEKLLQGRREALARVREREALLEERGRRLAELSELEARRRKQEEVFCGFIPSEEELNAAKETLGRIRETGAALNTIPTQSPDAEELADLNALFAEGIPTAQTIDAQLGLCDQLRLARENKKRLEEELTSLAPEASFSAGVPTPEDFDSMFESLERAKQMSAEAERASQQASREVEGIARRRRSRMGISICSLCVGALIAGAAFLTDGFLFYALLGVGAVTVILSSVLLALFSRKGEAQRSEERLLATVESYRKSAQSERTRVVRFLERHGQNTEGDLNRSLGELSYAAIRARKNVHRRRAIGEEIRETGRAAETLRAQIASFVSRYDPHAQEAEFSRVLSALRRDAERCVVLRRDEARRKAQRERLQETLESLQSNLRPFLKRYDTTNSRRAGEIVAGVSDACVTYRALSEEYRQKERALRAFVAEKSLDRPLPEEALPSAEELGVAERENRTLLTNLRQTYTRLGVELERLGGELDRMPELERVIAATEERLATYVANCKTVLAAKQMLAEAKEALSTRYLGGMQESFLHYLGELTEGEIPEAVIDSSFGVRARTLGESRELESFSRGNQDAVRFCVRLSLTDELHRDSERPFLLLDDPFVNLDEAHLQAARKLLEKLSARYQIIHMVCHEGRL